MTQFADDFEITQDQADAINARIAAGEEYAELYGDINEHRAEHDPYEPAPDPDIYYHHDQCNCPDCTGK